MAIFNSYFHITRPGNPPIEIAGEKPTRTVLVRRQVTVFMFSIQMASTGPSKSTWASPARNDLNGPSLQSEAILILQDESRSSMRYAISDGPRIIRCSDWRVDYIM